MKLADVFTAFRRRWIASLLCLLVTAGLAVGALQVVHQRYTATARILFLPPATSVPADANPFMQLGGLYQAVEMVGVALSDQGTGAEIKTVSRGADVTVIQDPLSSAPLLLVTVIDTDPQRTMNLLSMMVAKVPPRLDELQSSIAIRSTNRVTSIVLTRDRAAEPFGYDQLRAVIVAVAAGLLFTTLVVTFLDGLLLRRNEKAGDPGASGSSDPH